MEKNIIKLKKMLKLEDFLLEDIDRGNQFLLEVRTYLFLDGFTASEAVSDYKDLITNKYNIPSKLFYQACVFLQDNEKYLPLKYKVNQK